MGMDDVVFRANQRTQRRKRLYIDPVMIMDALELPDDMTITGLFVSHDPLSLVAIVESDDFEEIPYDSEAPPLRWSYELQSVTVDEGPDFTRKVVKLHE